MLNIINPWNIFKTSNSHFFLRGQSPVKPGEIQLSTKLRSLFSSTTQLAKQHRLAQLITSCFLKHFLGLNATLLFSSSLMAHITLSPTVMKKVMQILSQSESLAFSQRLTQSQNHKVIDAVRHESISHAQAHCQAWDSAHTGPCPEVPPLTSLPSQSMDSPESLSLLFVHMEPNRVLLANPRHCPQHLVEKKRGGLVTIMFLSPINSLS